MTVPQPARKYALTCGATVALTGLGMHSARGSLEVYHTRRHLRTTGMQCFGLWCACQVENRMTHKVTSQIAKLLKQRGHLVTREGSLHDIFLPIGQADSEVIDSFKVLLYSLMRDDEFRKSFRNWAFMNEFDSSANSQRLQAYITLCNKFGGWGEDKLGNRQQRYASTFEWYVSQLLIREFAARASGFSLRLKDAHPEDEFDCIAFLDEGAVFVECKTGKNKIYGDVVKFARRDLEVDATYSFYLFDRDYIFTRGSDDLPELSRERALEVGILGMSKVTVRSHAFFEVWSRPNERGHRYFLAASAMDGFEDRLRYMIRYCRENKSNPGASAEIYRREPIFFYGIDPLGSLQQTYKNIVDRQEQN